MKSRSKEIKEQVESNSRKLDKIVDDIINPYCNDLDEYVGFIKDCLCNGETPATTKELEDFCMNLSTYIYFAGAMTERLGIRDDISKAIYKEMYNTQRDSIDKGTVADKNSLAELASQEEAIISAAYSRAYKIMKGKVENAQELLGSCKKVLSHRMLEEEMTNFNGGR
jgi:hypothetical protein